MVSAGSVKLWSRIQPFVGFSIEVTHAPQCIGYAEADSTSEDDGLIGANAVLLSIAWE